MQLTTSFHMNNDTPALSNLYHWRMMISARPTNDDKFSVAICNTIPMILSRGIYFISSPICAIRGYCDITITPTNNKFSIRIYNVIPRIRKLCYFRWRCPCFTIC